MSENTEGRPTYRYTIVTGDSEWQAHVNYGWEPISIAYSSGILKTLMRIEVEGADDRRK